MENIGFEILMWFLGILSSVITIVLLPALASWLKSKTENQDLQYVINELEQTVSTSVDYIEQTVVKQLKADGKWDAEGQKEALDEAVTVVLNSLTDKTAEILGKNGIDLESIIIKYIESKILSDKIILKN